MFLPEDPATKICMDFLWNNGTWDPVAENVQSSYPEHAKLFSDYHACVDKYTPILKECAREHLDKPCSKSKICAMKTCRSPIRVASRLLNDYPNYKVVHLFRDPRGAVNSRGKISWSKADYAGDNLTRLAQLYCGDVIRDRKGRMELEQKHPGRTKELIYDFFMMHPKELTKDLYNFAKGSHVPKEVTKYLDSCLQSGSHAKWSKSLSPKNQSDILNGCKEFYTTIQGPWSDEVSMW